jgi:hypothetical protein
MWLPYICVLRQRKGIGDLSYICCFIVVRGVKILLIYHFVIESIKFNPRFGKTQISYPIMGTVRHEYDTMLLMWAVSFI